MFPPGARPELNTEIVIGETDYDSYAIMYYQKQDKITMKLYGGFPSHVTVVLYLRSECQVLIMLFYAAKLKLNRIFKKCICKVKMFAFVLCMQAGLWTICQSQC